VVAGSLVGLGETERLLLRAPREEDAEVLVSLWTDPRVTQHVGGPRNAAGVREHFGEYACQPARFVEVEREWWWVVIEKCSGRLVGVCSLLEKEVAGQRALELGYFLLAMYWGRGYASEAARRVVEYAFTELRVESLVAIIDRENRASIRVAGKLGMRLEGEEKRSDGVVRQVYRLERSAWGSAGA
jgi:RimJ/RimL family protein N-acetyltransferase